MKQRLFSSLIFKIGLIIILIEIVVLTSTGIYYTRQFNEAVDARVYSRVAIPGQLMAKGMLEYEVVRDRVEMTELAGDDLVEAMVIAVTGKVFYSFHTEYEGRDTSEVPGLSSDWFSPSVTESFVREETEGGNRYVVSVTPIFAGETRKPYYFFYLKMLTNQAAQEKQDITGLFLTGAIACVVLTSLAILLIFRIMISRRLSATLHGLKRFEGGDLDARIEPVRSNDEIAILQRGVNSMAAELQEKVGDLEEEIAERVQAEERIAHLNRFLQAIRNVNQLITQERDLDRLLERACGYLIETASYNAAWILLINDDGAPTKFVRQAVDGSIHSLADLLEEGKMMACTQAVLTQEGTQIIRGEGDLCKDCFFIPSPTPMDAMAIRLEFNGVIYGLLNITVLPEYAIDAEETALFAELAGDISFALHGLEIEEERERVEERARRLLEQQIAVNQLALALGETRDLDAIHHVIYEHARLLVDADAFIVAFYDSETQLIHAGYVVSRGEVRDVTNFPPIPLEEAGKGTQSQVIHTGESLYAPDVRKLMEKTKTEYKIAENGTVSEGPPPPENQEDSTNSALYVPMKVEGEVIGVMQLQSRRLDAYSQEDIDLLAGMANVAAVAVQNARLYGEVERELAERMRAEEELRKHREHLEELVRERTAELRRIVNLMAGREVRMAELKDVIRQLRAQLEEAGLVPVADDPLLAG